MAGDDTLAQILDRQSMSIGDLTGSTVGDFQVERLLGRGGMGEVYLATQLSLNRPVALKVLRPDVMVKPGYRERFESEALAVAKLNHPNIVHVYAMAQIEQVHFIAMEYVEGTNLRDYVVKRGALDLPQALSIIKQAAQAIGAAGEAGIIHRDVKPENILMTRRGRVKVADFGLCRQMDEEGPQLTQVGVTMGTPAYMSPEQAQGHALDHRSELYSLGATCYFMLAGVPPFRAESAVAVALKHIRELPASLAMQRPDLPLEIDRLVMKLLAKDPADRFQSAAELLAELTKVRGAVQVAPGAASGTLDALEPAGAPTEEVGQPAVRGVPAVRAKESSVPAATRRAVPAEPVPLVAEPVGGATEPSAAGGPRFSGLIATAAVALGLFAGAVAGWASRAPDLQALALEPSRRPPGLWIEPRWTAIPKQASATDQMRYAQIGAARDDWAAAWLAVPGHHPHSHPEASKAYTQLARLWYRRGDVEALAALGAELTGWKDAQKLDKDLAGVIQLALDLKKGDLGAVQKGFERLSEHEVTEMYEASLVSMNLEVCNDALQLAQKSSALTITPALQQALRRLARQLSVIEIGAPGAGAGARPKAAAGKAAAKAAAAKRPGGS
jgi:eukaryotic-like serine/threonine-protein kinase